MIQTFEKVQLLNINDLLKKEHYYNFENILKNIYSSDSFENKKEMNDI